MQGAARRQKRNYGKNAVAKSYPVGSFMWLYNEVRKRGKSLKLEFKRHGPYLVMKKLSDVLNRIQQQNPSQRSCISID